MDSSFKKGIITIEVATKNIEELLNILWKEEIQVFRINKKNRNTIEITINYSDFEHVRNIIIDCFGKFRIVNKKGHVFIIEKIKKRMSLLIAPFVFACVLYYLSTFIWAVEIQDGGNISPFDLRMELKNLGVEPGINKSKIDVYELEKKLESYNRELLWVRLRTEGSTLKVAFEEKINSPKIKQENNNICIAKMGGEIKRIYVTSGTAKVEVGDIVKKGDVLINPIEGKEGTEYETPAEGVVIASTFYEKEMEVQISGKKLVRSGNEDKEIYFEIFKHKIYIKKATNSFDYYDKIEENKKIFKTVNYYEKVEEEINIEKQLAINKCVESLKESLLKELINDSKVTGNSVYVKDGEENGKIRVLVTFLVEQDIAIK